MRYKKPLWVSMTTLCVDPEPAEFSVCTLPLSMSAKLNTWMPPPPSLTAYIYVPYVLMSRQRLFGPSSEATTCALPGFVISTMTVPLLVPISAYSLPEEETYPQQSLPESAPSSSFNGNHDFSCIFSEVNPRARSSPRLRSARYAGAFTAG